jgi:hypothetical protein
VTDDDLLRRALRDIAAIPCACERMNVKTEMREHFEVVRNGVREAHWFGCHVTIAARVLGGVL